MQLRKKWLKLISAALLTVLLSCLLSAVFWPEKTSQFIGYRFYTVLTDSMEPIIPTHSLVFSKRIDEDEPLQPDTIVTFHANRFGKDILLTHYFKKTQVKDGITYYRTQGASAKDYDNYETTLQTYYLEPFLSDHFQWKCLCPEKNDHSDRLSDNGRICHRKFKNHIRISGENHGDTDE